MIQESGVDGNLMSTIRTNEKEQKKKKEKSIKMAEEKKEQMDVKKREHQIMNTEEIKKKLRYAVIKAILENRCSTFTTYFLNPQK